MFMVYFQILEKEILLNLNALKLGNSFSNFREQPWLISTAPSKGSLETYHYLIILTCVDSDEHLQPTFKFRNSK